MSVQTLGPLWCDDFDTDLPKVVPHAMTMLGPATGIELQTYSHVTNGRINCPSSWWTDHGLTAFFSTPSYGAPAPIGYWTDKPCVDCTFAEVVRDEWIHESVVVVNGRFVWKPPSRLFERLMFDLRGWTPLAVDERLEIHQQVRATLYAASQRLLEACS